MGYGECLVTDVARDGMGTGPNLDLYSGLASIGVPVIASGGIRDAADLASLSSLPGLRGAVAGRALYEGTLAPSDMAEAGP